jgi:hypothetical protein
LIDIEKNFADRESAKFVHSEAAISGNVRRYRFPGAMQRATLLRRTGIVPNTALGTAPALQRTASQVP